MFIRDFILIFLMMDFISSQAQDIAIWPTGLYALPRPRTGCPPNWKEGLRYQDTENHMSNNYNSPSYHLSGSVNEHGVRQEFCVKDTEDLATNYSWPEGQYCIYKYGPKCPVGLKEGWVYWDDENDQFMDGGNLYRGYVPSGIYELDTLIYFCCSTEGDKNQPILLPFLQPFYLLAYGSPECQAVQRTVTTSEFIQWDDEDQGNANDHSQIVPYGVSLDRWNTRMYFCYYDTGGCGKDGTICQNSTVDESQVGKNVLMPEKEKRSKIPGVATTLERASGAAVAVGSSVAAIIFGTAVAAYLIRHFLTKRTNNMRRSGDGNSDDEEEIFPMPDELW